MAFDTTRHGGGEDIAIHRESAPCLNPRFVSALENHRAHCAHLGLEKAVRIRRLSTLERIGTDELGESVCVVRGSLTHGAHLEQRDLVPSFRELPGSFTASQPATNDLYDVHG